MKAYLFAVGVASVVTGTCVQKAMAGTITGFARDLDGRAIGRVAITIRRSDDNTIVRQVDAAGRSVDFILSATDGQYSVTLPDGVFVVVTFSQNNRTPAVLQHVDVKEERPVTINVALPERKCRYCCRRRCARRCR